MGQRFTAVTIQTELTEPFVAHMYRWVLDGISQLLIGL